MAKPYGRIRWVDYYTDPPASAEYILRMHSNSQWVLERYCKSNGLLYSYEVLNFGYADPKDKDSFERILVDCRKAIHNNKTIWIAKEILF